MLLLFFKLMHLYDSGFHAKTLLCETLINCEITLGAFGVTGNMGNKNRLLSDMHYS